MNERGGYLLERTIADLFIRAGFEVKLEEWINGYEIDVFATKGTYKVAVECKHYEESQIVVRNVLHQWNSKRDFVGADKVIVVFFGKQYPTSEDYSLAKALNVVLIANDEISRLNSISDGNSLESKIEELVGFPSERQVRIKKWKRIGIGTAAIIGGALAWHYRETLMWILGIAGILVLVLMFMKNNPVKKRGRKKHG